jgi:hypothetical protein
MTRPTGQAAISRGKPFAPWGERAAPRGGPSAPRGRPPAPSPASRIPGASRSPRGAGGSPPGLHRPARDQHRLLAEPAPKIESMPLFDMTKHQSAGGWHLRLWLTALGGRPVGPRAVPCLFSFYCEPTKSPLTSRMTAAGPSIPPSGKLLRLPLPRVHVLCGGRWPMNLTLACR